MKGIMEIYYLLLEGKPYINIEEIYVTKRERYVDEPDSLEYYDQASNSGVGAIFLYLVYQ